MININLIILMLSTAFFVCSLTLSPLWYARRNKMTYAAALRVLWVEGFVAGAEDMAKDFVKAVKAVPPVLKKFVAYWYGPFCCWLENYRRQHRSRFVWGLDFECELRSLLGQYAFGQFVPYINVIYGVPSVIQIQYITQKAATDEAVQECMEHIVSKLRHYMSSYGLNFPFFPYYMIDGSEVSIFILYCEYAQEQPDFYKTIHTVIETKTSSTFGTLKECHIPKSSDNELILGYSANKWNDGGIVSAYIWENKKDPHALFAGSSGSSKTVTVQLLVRQLMQQMKDIVIADFKSGGDWDNIFSADRYGEYTDCDRILDEFYNSFVDTIKNKQYRERYLIFDEFGSYVLSKDSKEKKALMEKVSHIAFMGRSFGFHLILINQQFNADILPTAIRDQFTTRVLLGNRVFSETSAMMFPNVSIDKSVRLPNYHGYIATPQTDVDIIVIPELSSPQQLKRDLIALGKKYYD